MLDLRQTSEYAKYMQSLGWAVDGKTGSFAYIRKFPIVGNFIKLQRPQRVNNKIIERLIEKHKPFQFVIEPRSASPQGKPNILSDLGFRQSKSYFVPSKTIQIDLTNSEKRLLSKMHYKTRYNIKKALSNKLQAVSSKDIREFADFWQKCALTQRGTYLSQKNEIGKIYKAFDKNAHLVLVKKNNELLSGILMLCTKDAAYYMYAASTPAGKKLFAPTLNAWSAMILAKKLKKKVFDFEGIYDRRFPIKSWLGFTRFKESFGGREIEHPGAFQKFRLPV